MERKLTAREWAINFMMEMYSSPDRKTQIQAGWWDWFCKDSSLKAKTYKMGNIIKKINGQGKVNLDTTYIWFKNNCPLNGPLYDDFRFAKLEDGQVQFTTQIDCCWNKKKYTVYGRTPDGEFHSDKPLFETDSVKELVEWFNEPWEK